MNKKLEPVIWYDEEYDINFADFSIGNKEKSDKFYDLISKPRFRVKETEETYRTINYWDENGLLLGKRDVADTWRQFGIIDVIWLRILQSLKQYGMQNESLLTLKEYLFRTHDAKGRFLHFAFWMHVALNQNEVSLVVLADGRGDIATPQEVEKQRIFNNLGNSHIEIDFRNIVLSVINPKNKEGKLPTNLMRKLEKEESELLHTLSQEDVSSVTAHLKEGKIDRIEWKQIEANPELLFDMLRKKIKQSPNQTITIKQQDGKVLFVEQKQSYKAT